jgi:hypothetical protein
VGAIGSVLIMFGMSPGVVYGWKMSAIVRMAVFRSYGCWCAKGVDGIGFWSVLISVLVASTAISVGVNGTQPSAANWTQSSIV